MIERLWPTTDKLEMFARALAWLGSWGAEAPEQPANQPDGGAVAVCG